MNISGFTYVRNGFTFGYPFIESISSVLPIVDEMIVVIGDSIDGTKEAIIGLNDPKIKIIDSVWDEESRKNGKIFAQQSNLGIKMLKGKWALHIQVDEVIHENDLKKILKFMELADKRNDIDGLLFPFYHFWGDFNHIRNTRKTHAFEIRAFKNTGTVFSYKDSQGFRIYPSEDAYYQGNSGKKLRVLNTEVPIFHYSYTRNPKLMKAKANFFHRFWHDNRWIDTNTNDADFDYNDVDQLEDFALPHPSIMHSTIAQKDWSFIYKPEKSNMKWKDRLLYRFEKISGYRPFSYKNYLLRK
ncbi:MAG: glycosyltransferase [Saprospiraceae bacterium]